MKPEETGWPLIELGYGLVEIAEVMQGGKPALFFGRNGTGKIGEPTKPGRVVTHKETLAVLTFENVESLDIVAGTLQQIRERMVANQSAGSTALDNAADDR